MLVALPYHLKKVFYMIDAYTSDDLTPKDKKEKRAMYDALKDIYLLDTQ
ncbi:hypothetical protein NIES22_51020 [Calothrix brevissima NIES-22]|nr:hypothetical protein NIES22_51020 [Calothrix brevissima NIES-22]